MREIWTVSSAGWLWFECREREMRKKVKDAETRDHSHGSPSQRFRGHIFINVFFLSPPRLFFLWRIKRFHTCWLFVFFRIRPKFPSNWDSIHRLFSLTHFQHENETLAKLMDVLVKAKLTSESPFFSPSPFHRKKVARWFTSNNQGSRRTLSQKKTFPIVNGVFFFQDSLGVFSLLFCFSGQQNKRVSNVKEDGVITATSLPNKEWKQYDCKKEGERDECDSELRPFFSLSLANDIRDHDVVLVRGNFLFQNITYKQCGHGAGQEKDRQL